MAGISPGYNAVSCLPPCFCSKTMALSCRALLLLSLPGLRTMSILLHVSTLARILPLVVRSPTMSVSLGDWWLAFARFLGLAPSTWSSLDSSLGTSACFSRPSLSRPFWLFCFDKSHVSLSTFQVLPGILSPTQAKWQPEKQGRKGSHVEWCVSCIVLNKTVLNLSIFLKNIPSLWENRQQTSNSGCLGIWEGEGKGGFGEELVCLLQRPSASSVSFSFVFFFKKEVFTHYLGKLKITNNKLSN